MTRKTSHKKGNSQNARNEAEEREKNRTENKKQSISN